MPKEVKNPETPEAFSFRPQLKPGGEDDATFAYLKRNAKKRFDKDADARKAVSGRMAAVKKM